METIKIPRNCDVCGKEYYFPGIPLSICINCYNKRVSDKAIEFYQSQYLLELTMKPGSRKILPSVQGKDVLFWNKLLGNNTDIFDSDTYILTKCFQVQHNLTSDGIVDSMTWHAAQHGMYAERYKQLYKEMYDNCEPKIDTKGLNIKWISLVSGGWAFRNLDTDVRIDVPEKGSMMFKMYQIALCASHELARRGE